MEKLVSQPRTSSVEGYHSALGRAKFEPKHCLWGVLPSRERQQGRLEGMPDSLWHEICAILWVRAAGAEKPWLGLCDRWSSCDNQMRWQTRAFRMQGKKKRSLFFATTRELTAAPRSWREGIGPLCHYWAKVLVTGKGGLVDTMSISF